MVLVTLEQAMENAEALAVSDISQVPSSPDDDAATRDVVLSQIQREKITSWVLMGLFGLMTLASFKGGVLNGIITAIVAFFLYSGLMAAIGFLVFKPMRALRFGPCVTRMSMIAEQSIDLVRWNSWKSPLPQFIAIDPSRQSLFIEGPDTNFRPLILRPAQIVEVKVEREQTVHTSTSHGSRMTYSFGSSGFGLIGGGRSRSTSKVVETAFLEIAYVPDAASTPRRIVLGFGTQRREADDWVMAIRHMGAAG